MSPTSYQTAPPRELMITTSIGGRQTAVGIIFPNTSSNSSACDVRKQPQFCWDRSPLCRPVLPEFSHPYQSENSLGGRLCIIDVNFVLARDVTAPVAQEREGNADLVGKCFVREWAVHAHTQDLGVGGFQLLQVLLEVFHLLRSTAGEGKDIKCQHHILLASAVAETHLLLTTRVHVWQFEIRCWVAHFQFEGSGRGLFVFCPQPLPTVWGDECGCQQGCYKGQCCFSHQFSLNSKAYPEREKRSTRMRISDCLQHEQTFTF